MKKLNETLRDLIKRMIAEINAELEKIKKREEELRKALAALEHLQD
jgi:prefoldin subunit 5